MAVSNTTVEPARAALANEGGLSVEGPGLETESAL